MDENGLGPLMGPLVVTGVLLKQPGKEVWFDDISDSKDFFSRNTNDFSRLEETATALFYLCNKKPPLSPLEILLSFCGIYKCLSGLNICTGNIPQEFIWSDDEKRKRRCELLCKWMDKKAIEIENIRSIAICPKRINMSIEKGNNKLFLDFFGFCDIVKAIPDKNGLTVYAGKVGGLKFYRKYLGYRLPDYQCEVIEENDEASLYRMEGKNENFTLGFFTDVENKSFSATLSSLIGKYIRELFMAGIRKTLGISEDISGYHDRKTKSCISKLSLNNFPSSCLFRER